MVMRSEWMEEWNGVLPLFLPTERRVVSTLQIRPEHSLRHATFFVVATALVLLVHFPLVFASVDLLHNHNRPDTFLLQNGGLSPSGNVFMQQDDFGLKYGKPWKN